jgi:hypothetical protein
MTQRGAPQLPTGRLNLCVTQAAHPPGLTDTRLNSHCRANRRTQPWEPGAWLECHILVLQLQRVAPSEPS